MASTRLVVQCSSRASGRQLHRSQRNVGPSSANLLAPRSSCLHTTSFQASGIHGASTSTSVGLSTDMSVLSAFENKTREGSGSKGWSSWEVMASTMLAMAATGSFLVGTVSSPSFSTDIYHRGSGGGGSGGRGPSSGSPAAPKPEEKEAESKVVAMEDGTGVAYQVSARALQGGRLTMEDEYFVADGGRFAAVFDGHGGGGVSATLRDRLFNLVTDNLRRSDKLEEKTKLCRPPLSSYVAALRSAFQQIDNDILEDDTLQYQGSTAVAVLVHEGDDGHRTLLSANVGDSRAILSRNGRAVDLTRDHKPNDEREKARIMAMGETIEWDHYCKVHRVKNLSLSRAIGDRFAKPVVTAEVEIKHFPAADEGDEFFLLASDGLWDVMTSQDVVSFVHQKLKSATPKSGLMSQEDSAKLNRLRRQKMSSAVAKEALRRGSGDNVCVVIVWLNDDEDPARSC